MNVLDGLVSTAGSPISSATSLISFSAFARVAVCKSGLGCRAGVTRLADG
jgi:hypothetical protein